MTAMHHGLIHYHQNAPAPVPLPRHAERLAAGAVAQRSRLIRASADQQRSDPGTLRRERPGTRGGGEGLNGASRPGARKAVRPLHRPGGASAAALLTPGLPPGSRSRTPTAVPRAAFRQVPRAGRPMASRYRYPPVRIPLVAGRWAARPGREHHCPHRAGSQERSRRQDRLVKRHPRLARPQPDRRTGYRGRTSPRPGDGHWQDRLVKRHPRLARPQPDRRTGYRGPTGPRPGPGRPRLARPQPGLRGGGYRGRAGPLPGPGCLGA